MCAQTIVYIKHIYIILYLLMHVKFFSDFFPFLVHFGYIGSRYTSHYT